jgi:hypothetical protein
MLLDVSPGEGFDKLSILEIKYARIAQPEKREAVLCEVNALSDVERLKKRYPFEYASLMRVNEEMWDLTEVLDSEDTDSFSRSAARIFELNRQRFRVKRMINNAENSNLKEQKSFGDKHCVIELDVDPYSRIAGLYSIVFEYDTFSFDRPCKLRPFLNFLDSAPETFVTVKLSALGQKIEVSPICYGSGGLLGDTLHQLSIVNEMYLKTGRKGIVYLSNTLGDVFNNDLTTTLADVGPILKTQPYIESLQIHDGQSIDVNLSAWRTTTRSHEKSWQQIFGEAYNVTWSSTPWISTVPNLQYRDTVFLSVGVKRYNWVVRYQELCDRIPNLVFLATSHAMYDVFVERTGVRMPYLICPTFSDLALVIMACKGIIANLSMPLALADAMWKPRIAITYDPGNENKISTLSDSRAILYTEDLDAFGWMPPPHPHLQRS